MTDHAMCPECGYRIGLGTFSEPGLCPNCKTALMFTCEFRALSPEDLREESKRRARELSAS